jgi:hypothetical protein
METSAIEERINKRKKFLDPVVDKRIEREAFMVNLRKKNKQIIFNKKRKLFTHSQKEEAERILKENKGIDDPSLRTSLMKIDQRLYSTTTSLEDKLDIVFANLLDLDQNAEFYILHLTYLKWIAVEFTEETIDYVISTGNVPVLAKYLETTDPGVLNEV